MASAMQEANLGAQIGGMTKYSRLLPSQHGACGSKGKFVLMSSLDLRRVADEDLTDRSD